MSGFYNAVICDKGKIVARTHLTDFKNIPEGWEIRDFDGNQRFSAEDLSNGFIDPAKPLQIAKQEFEISFPYRKENVLLKVNPSMLVRDLGAMIGKLKGTDEPCLCCFAVAKEEKWKYFVNKPRFSLAKMGISSVTASRIVDATKYFPDAFSCFHTVNEHKQIVLKRKLDLKRDYWKQKYWSLGIRPHKPGELVGAGPAPSLVYGVPGRFASRGLSFGNLNSKHLKTGVGRDVKPENYWRSYANGLNLKGNCDNQKCKSRKYKTRDMVVVTLDKEGEVKLTPDTKYDCPACDKPNGFTPTNFLLSGVRCAFRYKLTGDKVLKLVTFGAKAYPKYAMLKDQTDKAEYDWIHIRTVKWDESPHDCVICGEEIGKLKDEITSHLENCEHFWHKDCNDQQDCRVCLAKTVWESGITKVCFNIEKN